MCLRKILRLTFWFPHTSGRGINQTRPLTVSVMLRFENLWNRLQTDCTAVTAAQAALVPAWWSVAGGCQAGQCALHHTERRGAQAYRYGRLCLAKANMQNSNEGYRTLTALYLSCSWMPSSNQHWKSAPLFGASCRWGTPWLCMRLSATDPKPELKGSGRALLAQYITALLLYQNSFNPEIQIPAGWAQSA